MLLSNEFTMFRAKLGHEERHVLAYCDFLCIEWIQQEFLAKDWARFCLSVLHALFLFNDFLLLPASLLKRGSPTFPVVPYITAEGRASGKTLWSKRPSTVKPARAGYFISQGLRGAGTRLMTAFCFVLFCLRGLASEPESEELH